MKPNDYYKRRDELRKQLKFAYVADYDKDYMNSLREMLSAYSINGIKLL